MTASNPWLRLSLNAFRLGAEANSVVALRMMKIAGGGAGAAKETQLMVSEKIQAAIEAQSQLAIGAMTGAAPHVGPAKAVALYRRKVRANRRRLLKRGA